MRKFALISLLTAAFGLGPALAQTALLNASYDPTGELYKDFNAAFARHWQGKSRQMVNVRQSHGGSGKQARSVAGRKPGRRISPMAGPSTRSI
jgi:sulfate/thiosulfate transport system substrate-binding protein